MLTDYTICPGFLFFLPAAPGKRAAFVQEPAVPRISVCPWHPELQRKKVGTEVTYVAEHTTLSQLAAKVLAVSHGCLLAYFFS